MVNCKVNGVVFRGMDNEAITYGIGLAEEHDRCYTYVDIEAVAAAALPASVASDDVVVFDVNFHVLYTLM